MHNKRFFLLTEAALAIMIVLVVFAMFHEKNGREQEKVSVIVRDSDDKQWSAFRYGLKMGAKDWGVDLFVISTEDSFTPLEEQRLIERELENGADAVIVQPALGEDTGEMLEKVSKKLPLMLVESEPLGEDFNLPVTEPDHYAMGKALAEELLQDYSGSLLGKTYGILSGSKGSKAALEREQGFLETIEGTGGTLLWNITWESGRPEEMPKADFVIALEDGGLILAGKEAALGAIHGAVVYGIGNSTEAVYYLDSGYVQALVVPDQFQAGYQSLGELAAKLRREKRVMESQQISHTILRRSDLFTKENQKILFTMSQ